MAEGEGWIPETIEADSQEALRNAARELAPDEQPALAAEDGRPEEQPMTPPAKAVDGSGDEEASEQEGDVPRQAVEELPEEEWMSWPHRERELWERVRTKALRREAQVLRSLRLPAAAVVRLMKMHPRLQGQSADVRELIGLATVLLLQATVKVTSRGKAPGQRLTYEDLKQVCNSSKEFQCLQPLASTLDSSMFTLRATSGTTGETEEAPASPDAAAKPQTHRPGKGRQRIAHPKARPQNTLNSAFQKAATALESSEAAPEQKDAEVAEPEEGRDGKRRPQLAEERPTKVPKLQAGKNVPKVNLATFFRRMAPEVAVTTEQAAHVEP